MAKRQALTTRRVQRPLTITNGRDNVTERVFSRCIHLVSAMLLTLALGGCGGGASSGSGTELSGAYVPQGEAMYKRFEFQPGHKVAVTFIMAQPTVLDYVVMPDGRISILGDKVQKLRDAGDGCLVLIGAGADGVEIDLPDFGRYCPE
jgi:hypothetical protein